MTSGAELAALLLLVPLKLLAAIWNLEAYPTISGWDEGIYLQFAHNLAHHGEYATVDGETFRRLTPVGGTGPTVIVPVALALWLGGDQLVAARLVIVAYLAATLAGAYLISRLIAGPRAALISLPLVLTAGQASYDVLWHGRQVLAEIPAAAFLLGGTYIWMTPWKSRLLKPTLIYLCFALGIVCKSQMAAFVCASFAVILVADYVLFRSSRVINNVMPILGSLSGAAIWYALTYVLVGMGDWSTYRETYAVLAASSLMNVSLYGIMSNLKLLRHGQHILPSLLGIAYLFWSSRSYDRDGLRRFAIAMMALTSLTVFAFTNVPWPRYTLIPLLIAAIAVAVLLDDLVTRLSNRYQLISRYAPVALICAVMLIAGPGLMRQAAAVTSAGDRSAERFAERLRSHVPHTRTIYSWEWEIEFYSEHQFVHPPHLLFAAMVGQVYGQREHPILQAPRIPSDVELVVIGPFAEQTRVFHEALAERQPRLVVAEGPYRLYQVSRTAVAE